MTAHMTPRSDDSRRTLEASIARLIMGGTYVSVLLITIGVIILVLGGQSPLAGAPRFEVSRIVTDFAGLRPEAFLWIGLVIVIATPSARVTAALIGYGRRREWGMALVATLILVVIGLGIAAGLAGS